LATKSQDVGLIEHAISFQDFQPMWSWSTNVTDRQTDRHMDRRRVIVIRHAITRLLCTIVHRVVKT